MQGIDSASLGDLIAELIGDYSDKSIAPLLKRLAEMDARLAQLEEFVTSGGVASAARPTS